MTRRIPSCEFDEPFQPFQTLRLIYLYRLTSLFASSHIAH